MVVLSQPVTLDNHISIIPTYKPVPVITSHSIPVVNLTDPEAKTQIVKACEEFGFFKVVNHGVRTELMNRLEEEAIGFFGLPQSLKNRAGPPEPYGYGNKRIGPNGDVGWIEYILLNANIPQLSSPNSSAVFLQSPQIFREAVEEYMKEVKQVSCNVLEMIAEGLGIEPRESLSKMVRDEKSDSCLRLNHYPEAEEEEEEEEKKTVKLGFGEHTDPQIISVLRSNNTNGLQICLKDGSWVAVTPDKSSFFINVGDALQVMTNGRFKSVKHRVLADTRKSRVSMIYFCGPQLSQKIAPLSCLVPKQEDWLYKEFTWSQYKSSAYKSKLGDYRLGLFEKQPLMNHKI